MSKVVSHGNRLTLLSPSILVLLILELILGFGVLKPDFSPLGKKFYR